MHRRFQLIVGGIFVALSVLLEAVESFNVLRELIPEKLAEKINQLNVVVLFCVGILFLWLGKNSHEEGSGSSPSIVTANAGNATATGNKIEQHFHIDGQPIEELATAIARQLKSGAAPLVSAKQEADAAVPPRLDVNDGFVQMEEVNLAVSSPELAAGQTVTATYFYANRGVLPVYEVQTWGLMQVLDPRSNSGAHLKAVMIAGAKEGHSKFPGAATLGVQRRNHAFAPLSEPFTQDQIDSLGNKTAMLFLLVGGVWVDNNGEPHFWAVCQQAEFRQGLTWNNFAWRDL
jgi:hypothetical protein